MGFVTLGVDNDEAVAGARARAGVWPLDTEDLSVELEEPIEPLEIEAGFSLSIEGTTE